MTDYKHLKIKKAPLENPRRTRKFNIQPTIRTNKKSHGQKLANDLSIAINKLKDDEPSKSNNKILKIKYDGYDFENLSKHGITFVSQEENKSCIVLSDDNGVKILLDHIIMYINEDDNLTYKKIIEDIDEIDTWSPENRKSWIIKNKGFPDGEKLVLDVELWPIGNQNDPHRIARCNAFEEWILNSSTRRLDKINLDSLLIYRIEVDRSLIDQLLNYSDVRLVDLLPESGISIKQLNVDITSLPRSIPRPSESSARVCILDSGIATNHPLLASAMADSFNTIEDEDFADQNGHGTAVASVALYGDLEACLESDYWKPELLLFNGKILDRHGNFSEDLIESSLIKTVEYFASEQNCRIFNLSIGNSNSPYDGNHIRGIAYTLDLLARQLGILFIVSAGNFNGSTNPDIPLNGWREDYPAYLLEDINSIIDPAPALNVLTVGSLARHTATFNQQRYPEINELSPAREGQPSPFTRHGPSVKGAIKPELMATGGNLASKMRTDNQNKFSNRGLGVLTLNNNFTENLFCENSGTSFSAPYITYLAGRLLNNYPDASTNLIRALLVNHANLLPEISSTFDDELQNSYKNSKKRDCFRDVAGYGKIDENELFRSSENVVVLMLEDKIRNDTHHFIELPLPPEFLRSETATRQIMVTLSYCPAVRTTRKDYKATKMSFCLVKEESLDILQQHFNNQTQEHFGARNDDAVGNRDVSKELRSKGTVQSSTWTVRRRNPNEKWFVVITRQDKPWAESLSFEEEHYALVVTLADRENENAQLYTQISQKIQNQVQQRTRV